MRNFVRTFSIMRAQGERLIVIEEVRNYEKIVYIKNIYENGLWENAYPSSYPPGSTPGYPLEKPSKESGIFQSLGAINLVLFLLKAESKGGGGGAWHNAPLPKYAPALK